MDFGPKERLKADPLKLLLLIGEKIFKPKIVRVYFLLNILGFIIFMVFQLYYFVYEMTVVEIINYCPLFFVGLHTANAQLVLLLKSKAMENVTKDLYAWELDSAGPEVNAVINRRVRLTIIYAAFNVIAAVVTAALFCLIDESDNDVNFILNWASVFSHLYKLAVFVVRLETLPTFYTMMVHSIESVYISQHFNIQALMLVEHIRNISTPPPIGSGEIKRRIKFCVERHLEIVHAVNKTNHDIGFSFISFTLSGGLLGISAILFALEGTVMASYKRIAQLVSTTVIYLLTFIGIIYSGQALEDRSEKATAALLSNEWYSWSHSNKATLLIFLPNIMKPLRRSYLTYFTVDYGLGVSIGRAAYSVVSVMMRLKHKTK